MIHCLQFCLNFAFNFNLRRYTVEKLDTQSLDLLLHTVERIVVQVREAGAYTRPAFNSM